MSRILVVAVVVGLAAQVQCFNAAGPQARRTEESSADPFSSALEAISSAIPTLLEALSDKSATCSNPAWLLGAKQQLSGALSDLGISQGTQTALLSCVCSFEMPISLMTALGGLGQDDSTTSIEDILDAVISSIGGIMSTETGLCQAGYCKTALLGVFQEMMVTLLGLIPVEMGLPDMSPTALEIMTNVDGMWGCVCGGTMQFDIFANALKGGIASIVQVFSVEPLSIPNVVTAVANVATVVLPMAFSDAMFCGGTCQAVFGQTVSLFLGIAFDVFGYIAASDFFPSLTGNVVSNWSEAWRKSFANAVTEIGVDMPSTWTSLTSCMCSASIDWAGLVAKAAATFKNVWAKIGDYEDGGAVPALATLAGTELQSWAPYIFSDKLLCSAACKTAMADLASMMTQVGWVVIMYAGSGPAEAYFSANLPDQAGQFKGVAIALAGMADQVPMTYINQMGQSMAQSADCLCGGTIDFAALISTTSATWGVIDSLINADSTAQEGADFVNLVTTGIDAVGDGFEKIFSSKGICGGVCPTVGADLLDMFDPINGMVKSYLATKGYADTPDFFPAGIKRAAESWTACLCSGIPFAEVTTIANEAAQAALGKLSDQYLSNPSWYLGYAKKLVTKLMGPTMMCNSHCVAAMSASIAVAVDVPGFNWAVPKLGSLISYYLAEELSGKTIDLSTLTLPTDLGNNMASLAYCACDNIDWDGFFAFVETNALPIVQDILTGKFAATSSSVKALVIDKALPALLAPDFLICSGSCESTIAAITVDLVSMAGTAYSIVKDLLSDVLPPEVAYQLSTMLGDSLVTKTQKAMDSGCLCAADTDWGTFYDKAEKAVSNVVTLDPAALLDSFMNTITQCPAATAVTEDKVVVFEAVMDASYDDFPTEQVCANFAAGVGVERSQVECSVRAGSVIFTGVVLTSGILQRASITANLAQLSSPSAVETALKLDDFNIAVTEVLPPQSIPASSISPPPPPPPAPPLPPPPAAALSIGVIIGIAVGAGVFFAIVVGIIAYCLCCKKKAATAPAKVQA